MNNIPDISSFQYDKAANGHIESSINMYRGAVCFHYNLLELPGHENVRISVHAAYDSDVDKTITQNNLISPTGIMGLGWRLTYEKIECDKTDIAKKPESRNYRLTTGDNSGGGSPLHLIEEKDGCLYFENEIYDYSQIIYDSAAQLWTITDADGVKRLYGGKGHMQYAVLNHGRYTESGCTDEGGQSRAVKAWNLSKLVSPDGFEVSYEYEFIEQPVTEHSLTYTKAAYISKISDSYGNLVRFLYMDKEWSADERNPREYIDPHKDKPSDGFDFYQSEYETKYLSEISVSNQYAALYHIRFTYELQNYAAEPPILGNTVKRMLSSIQMITEHGKMPAMQFLYNNERERNAGALKKIIYPEGGSAEYTYGQNQQLTMSERTQIVSNSGFTEAVQTCFGKDYVVILQRNAGKAVVTVYEWIGRWQKNTPDISLDGFAGETIKVYPMDNYCIITGITPDGMGAGYSILTKKRKIKGGWSASKIEAVRTSNPEVITGDKWFFLYDTDYDKVAYFEYQEAEEVWTKGVFPEAEESGYTRYFSACGNRVFCFAYDEDGGGRKNRITLYERNPFSSWTKLAETFDSSIVLQKGSNGDCSFTFDGWMAAGAFVFPKTSGNQSYTLGIWRYDMTEILRGDVLSQLSIPVEEPSYIMPRIAGNTVISAGYLYRFCGNGWKVCKELAIVREGEYQFALSEDIALASFVTDDRVEIKGAVFDKKKKEWNVRTLLQRERSKIPSCGVSISGNLAICGDMVYDIGNLTFERRLEKLDYHCGSTITYNNGICIAGSVYKNEKDDKCEADSAYIHTFKNGKLIDRSFDNRIYDENCGGSGNIFALRGSNDIKLLFAGGGSPDEPVTFYYASSVKLHDGMDVITRKYRYDTSRAACDESGQYARYAKVEVVNGNDDGAYKIVYRYYDAVSSVSQFENAVESSVEDGTLISVEAYSDRKLCSRLTADYEFTNVINDRTIYGEVLSGGTLTQMSEIGEDGKGIVKTTRFSADLLSGGRKEMITDNYNIRGERETYRYITKFAYEKYLEMEKTHRLSNVCENILTVNGEMVSDEKREYAFTDGFFSEKSKLLVDIRGGRDEVFYDITKRGKFGVVMEKKALFPEYFVYDRTGCYRVAKFTNCHYGECFAYCFEDYEEPIYSPAFGAQLTDALCYAGTQCLMVESGRSSAPITHRFRSSGISYGFSFYAQGKEGARLLVKAKGKTKEMEITESEFRYYFMDLQEFAFTKEEEAQIEFVFVNDSDSPLFVDIISFFPLLNPPLINVYYNGGALVAASLSGYGDITEPVYDEVGRTVYLVGNKKVINAQIPSLMRETGDIVNSELILKNAGDGEFIKYISGEKGFRSSLELSENFFAVFFCSGSLDIAIGKSIRIKREKNTWSLTDEINSFRQTASYMGNLITIFLSEVVVFAVNGKVLFSYRQKNRQEASFVISAGEDVFNLAIGNESAGSILFYDGAGKNRQEQTCVDGRICVTARMYDEIGREHIVTIPTYMETDYFRYIRDYITDFDNDTGVMKGIVSDKNPECGGYPYSSNIYENRSGGRIVESGSPCPGYAVNNHVDRKERHTVRMAYAKDTSCIPGLKDLPPYYHVMSVLDPDHHKMMTVYDLRKNKIAVAAQVNDTMLLTTYEERYQNAQRIVSVTMPNGNKKESCYDFAGNLIRTSDVNAGERKFFYDKHHHIRFVKDEVLTKAGLCRYCRYDDLYRMVEEGLCPVLSDEELSKQAPNPSYPESGKIISKRYCYDGDYRINEIGRLTQVEIFDETKKNEVVSTIRISADKSRTEVSKTVTIGEESYQTTLCYDNFGNIISETGIDGSVTKYTYDYASRPIAVLRNDTILTETKYRADGLPEQVTSCQNMISYQYDARGKVIGIDSPFYREKVVYLENGKYYNGKVRSVETEIKGDTGSFAARIKYDLDYDEDGRLLSAYCKENPEFSLTDITYDGNGNMLSCKAGNIERKYTIQKGSDKLTSVNTSTYKYNENGAVTHINKEGAEELGIEYYQYSGLPKRFTKKGVTTEILYDENNRRLKKTVLAEGKKPYSSTYFYDGVKLSEEIRDGECLKYIHGAGGLQALSHGKIDYSVITDRLGYTRVVAECKKIIQAYHYKPFGETVKVIQESELVNLLFGNYELDKETGLYYAKSRIFDPDSYRFLSPDPDGEFPSPYIFCGNDPFAVIDENGERSWYAALIGTVIGIVLTIGLSVLTMGAAAPMATAVFGAGGTSITAATTAAKTAAIVAYNTAMTFTVTAVSGLASEGVKSLIDGEPYTASSVYDTLLGATASALVFGSAATLIGGVGKFVVGETEAGLAAAKKYVAQGAILSLVNSGVSAAVSPVSDVINGEAANGLNALENAGFGVLSGALTTFASACAESKILNIQKDIIKETVNDIIWAGFDPGVYYGAVMEVVDSAKEDSGYDEYCVGAKTYRKRDNSNEAVSVKSGQMLHRYACFSDTGTADSGAHSANGSYPYQNLVSPRYFATRGFAY